MISDYTIQERVRKFETATSHEEQLYNILKVYMDIFPVLDSYLVRYSPLGYLAEGIISINSTGLVHIGEIRDDIRSFPIIYSSIHERKAKYCSGLEYLKQTSSKYIMSSSINSLVIVPICFGSAVIGYICSSEFEEQAIDDKMLSSLTFYGKLIGNMIHSSNSAANSKQLSKRELEVMKRIAWGESSKEMAVSMEISELTVKQYVKTAIKKLGAQNRSHAVGELFRKGIIS
ncbi:DNA-binding NarL/FixJ family response regulator [Scopulibacillus darangshiensis]|uniref:DNA-binding NarL/FixJ family response regulator n=1 Tax=Scopulibacillus darangshiensis TaxID=442528 RepID=A0A4R2PBQ4_9BACL|nr:helix-turn-helix transcriptional regulator [Scopulibacillus darangshiensis]TCP31561.1 DNA-binding NarL/FixJ family response regulator [Scopulibacillus darangshiensis]